jgi:hypothetical protein
MTVSIKTAGKTAKLFGRVFALAPLFLLFFVAAPVFSQAPKLGKPTTLQAALNLMPAVPVSGQTLKFEFGGDIWIAKLNGKNLLAGTVVTQDTKDGNVMVLTQTHTYVGVAWVKTPGPDIILDYTPGPPAVLRPITRAEADEKLAAVEAAPQQ